MAEFILRISVNLKYWTSDFKDNYTIKTMEFVKRSFYL